MSQSPVARLRALRPAEGSDGVFPLNPPTVVGRFDPDSGPIDVDLGGLPDGGYVSRKHARIEFGDHGWTVQDLGSSNGTWMKQQGEWVRLDPDISMSLADGDHISFGQAQVVFELADAAPTAEEESADEDATEATDEPAEEPADGENAEEKSE
ncbi:MAG: FHA domain-containing protein [Fimbriimonadaceae bacterium]